MAQRVKGQEVEVIMLEDGAPQSSLNTAQSMNFTFKTERLREGYLGETTDRYDTVFHGVEGKVKFHFDNPAPFKITTDIINKARRRTPGTRFNLKASVSFPSGRRARVVFQDVEFGELPFNVGGRTEYVDFELDFGCSTAQVLPL